MTTATRKPAIQFSAEFKQAFHQCWQQIAPDLLEGWIGRKSNAAAVEAVVDADRLQFNGDSAAANQELKALVAAHGWKKVSSALSREFKLI